jgi:hypothetical protein
VSSIAGCIVVFTASYIYLILGPELTKAMGASRKEGTAQEMAEKTSLLQGGSGGGGGGGGSSSSSSSSSEV